MLRDLYVLTLIGTMLVFAFRKPQIGILAWLWISIMNPHRLTYGGLVYSMQILDVVAAVTILSCLAHSKDRAPAGFHPILKLLLVFYLWCCLTTIFGVDMTRSLGDWENYTKTLLLMVLMLLYMNKKHWIIACVAVFVISIGYTGVKGGLFTIVSGGEYRVWGPPKTAWGDNNGVSVACLMALPLTLASARLFSNRLYRLATYGAAAMFLITVLGTQSRGALVGLLAVLGSMVLRSQRRMLAIALVPFILIAVYLTMPQSWHDRMATITDIEDDLSAQTRLIQWKYAIDISLERPLFGNGFDAFFHQPYYRRFVAGRDTNRSVHSNYFQVLGEQGFIGLAMYLSVLAGLIFAGKGYAKKCVGREDLRWAGSMIGMAQFSLIGYAANGLTVNMAYLDLYYYMIAIMVLLISHIRQELGLNVKRPAVSYLAPVGQTLDARSR